VAANQGIATCDLGHIRCWLPSHIVADALGSSGRNSASESVRLAWPSEASGIAELQRRAWSSQPPEIAEALLGSIDAISMAEAWQAAIERPPQARCRVLVAVENGRLVGFATTVPGQDADLDDADDGQLEELEIDPQAQRRGHGSRLLNASIDTLRADGFRRAVCWISAADDARRTFLVDAGWATDGSWREIGSDEGGVRLKQVRLHTDLG
jgi:GNAT superfamily N-acetyltransferase